VSVYYIYVCEDFVMTV